MSGDTPVLRRPQQGRVVAGVAAGVAEHLGISVTAVRLAFVVLTFVGGFGVLVYAGLWLTVPDGTPERAHPPGVEPRLLNQALTNIGRGYCALPAAATASMYRA